MDCRIEEFKRKAGIGKISGLIMLHYFKWPKTRAKVVNALEVNVGTEWRVMEWLNQQGGFRERLLRALDDAPSDLLLFPDEDESYPEPEFFVDDLQRLHRSRKSQLAFTRCNFWDSKEMVRKDRWIYYGPHVKVYKWRPGLSCVPYLGFNRVNPYGRKSLVARASIKHYAYMEKEKKRLRYHELYGEKQDTFRMLLTEPRLVKYTNARRVPWT